MPLFIGNFIVGIFDFLNDKKIKENYNYLTSNWETNPIKSINLSYNEENEYENYSMLYNYSNTSNEIKYETFWKKYFIKFKRMDSYNYFESFKNENYYNKKCGKDSYGNDLYFPGEVDCPINEIFFSNFDEDLEDYTKIKLNDTYYLYYTNKSIEGKIIIDLINSSSIYNFPFYEEIDSNFNNQYFYSINYMGINTSSISERSLISKINKLEHNIKLYFILSIVKIVFFCIENIGLFMIGCFVEFKSYIIIIFIFIKMANIIILILCLNIHNIYINNFMNKINIFIEKEKNDIKWNVIILIYSLIFFVVYLFVLFWVICHTECRFHLDSLYDEEPKINIEVNNKKQLDKDTITSSTDSEKRVKRRNKDNEKKELNKKNEKIRELNEKYNTLKSNDNKKINKLKKDIEKLNEIINLKNEEIIKEKKEKEKLSEELNVMKENSNNILAAINEKEKEINFVRSSLPFQFKEGEKLMCVIFQNIDQSIHYPMICKNTQIFNNLENLLYEKFDKYKETENYFLCSGKRIIKTKTLEENNIKDGSIILLNVLE